MQWTDALPLMAVAAGFLALAPTDAPPSTAEAQPTGEFRVHPRVWPNAAFEQALVIETRGHTVVIDPGASPDHAAAIRSLLDSIGKPLAAVLLTHAHIDHYGALSWLDRRGAPVVSSAGVARQLGEYGAVNAARFGQSTPAPGVDRLLGSGDSLLVDGVPFVLGDEGPGESYADVWYRVSSSRGTVVVVGDLAMFGIPPFLQSGRSREWIGTLRGLLNRLPADAHLFIGHDLAAAGVDAPRRTRAILEWQIARLEAFRSAVAGITDRKRLLTPAEISQVTEMMHRDAPENLPDFDFLIGTTANILAAELIEEAEKETFERALRALFAGGTR